MPPTPPAPRVVYTLGHSNHAPEAFVALLGAHRVGHVADVRSRPYSRWPHFGRERLARLLGGAGIAYTWLGEALGGRPEDAALRGPDGAPDYAAMAARPAFREGIAALLGLLEGPARVAVLCSEGDPRRCHREHLVAAALRPRGVAVRHIGRDGALVTLEDEAAGGGAQLTLEV